MARFLYTSFDQDGNGKVGEIEATSQADAFSKLRDRGILPTSLVDKSLQRREIWRRSRNVAHRLTRKQKLTYVEQLAGYLAAGLTLDKSHGILAESSPSIPFANLCAMVNDQLASGQALASAWRLVEGFTETDIAVVEMAQRTGQLLPVLQQLAVDLRKQQEIAGKLMSAAVYPAFLVLMALGSLLLIATIVVPALDPLFEGNADARPLLVRFVMAANSLLTEHPLLVATGLACLIAMIWGLYVKGWMHIVFFGLSRRVPLVRRRGQARLARNLGLALTCGIPLQSAVRLMRETAANSAQRDALTKLEGMLAAGRKMSSALTELKFFDRGDLELLKVGEAGGRIAQSFMTIADRGERSVQEGVDRLMILLTPALTLLMGILIGSLMFSVMQSILSVNDLANQ